jgi:hypothetical protein
MSAEKLFLEHVQGADELVMVSIKDGLLTVFSTLQTEMEAIWLMNNAQRQLISKMKQEVNEDLEQQAKEETEKLIKRVDKGLH